MLALAQRERRILITNDKDFGELVFRERHPHASVVLLRFPLESTAQVKIHALEQFLASLPRPLAQFVVLTPQGSRMR